MEFMLDPVRNSTSDLTYNQDSMKHLPKPKDVLPNLRMREIMYKWFSHYDLEPIYDFISSQDELVAATKFVLKQRSTNILAEFVTCIKLYVIVHSPKHYEAWVIIKLLFALTLYGALGILKTSCNIKCTEECFIAWVATCL